MGKCICTYEDVVGSDARLQRAPSVERCVRLLRFLRLVTQVVLPRETLCWLLFNGACRVGVLPSGAVYCLG